MRVFSGGPYPEGTPFLILASDLRWYIKNAHGRVEEVDRSRAARWLRRERDLLKGGEVQAQTGDIPND